MQARTPALLVVGLDFDMRMWDLSLVGDSTLISRRDTVLLFLTRITRLFAYGFVSIILALYLAALGFSEGRIGLLLTLTLLGDAVISLWITISADRIGRRKMLLVGTGLMIIAGIVFLITDSYVVLVPAAIIGVISPSGKEIGPFLSIEQAALSQLVPDQRRTRIFAWYNLAGSFATASGALFGGWLAQNLRDSGFTAVEAYRAVLSGYVVCGILIGTFFLCLTRAIESATTADQPARFGLHRSKPVVMKLSALFAMDAFAGGFVIQSILAFWLHVRFGMEEAQIGSFFFAANLLAGVSALTAARLASRIGLVKTMVFTHVPSNILLFLVPVMPGPVSAVSLLLLRYSISQMDVPTRQSYTMAVVSPDERSAASGVTTIARSVGASLSPALSGILMSSPLPMGMPFFMAGGLKIVYDLLLYRSFKQIKPAEEI